MKKTVYLGMLLGFALILGYVESLVPFVFTIPGMKMGLPNLAILLTLSLFGEKEAFAVNTARVILSGFLFGNLSALIYSLSGAWFSFLIMVLCRRSRVFSLSGISLAGGTAHNLAQALAASLVTGTVQVLVYLPPLIICGAATGWILGLTGGQILRHIPMNHGRPK